MAKNPTILFIHFGTSSFVKEDLRILRAIGKLRTFHFQASKSPFSLLKNFVIQFFWLLKNIHSADLIYSWFSDYHSFLPTLFGKRFNVPSITVLGGFDCNKIESLNYGIFCSKWRAPLGKYVLNNSSLLLPVDETLIQTNPQSKNWGEAHPNGVTYNIPNFKTAWKAVPTGYEPTTWNAGPCQRSKVVSTIALCSSFRTVLIKGWDVFIETARKRPDFQFNIVGCLPSFVPQLKEKYQPPNNISFIPPQPREDLVDIYHETSVYLQLSRSEGLPNVLCEAMMCGCVPIGSSVFGIPNAIGNSGYVAQKPDPEEIAQLIVIAHNKASEFRQKAIHRILNYFSIEKREKGLRKIFGDLDIVS